MNKRIAATAIVLGCATAGAFAQDARAEAVEFFKCRLVDGATIAQLVDLANDFEGTVAEDGLEGYSISFLTPLYASDISRGTFWWVGVAPDFSGAGKVNDIWESDAGKASRDLWESLTSGCENSSLFNLTRTPDEDEME